jgi:hypothetical protein
MVTQVELGLFLVSGKKVWAMINVQILILNLGISNVGIVKF